MSNIEVALRAASGEVIEFFREHPDTCIVQSDKGKKTCLMLKKDYMAKMSNYVDQCLFRGVYVPPIARVVHVAVAAFKQLRTAIMAAVNTGTVSLPPRLLERLNGFNFSTLEIPRLYGTVKCHKIDTPMRPICTTLRWMSRPIQQLLLHIFKGLFNDKICSQNVSNIDHVARDISRLKLRKGYVLVKFDVHDMYGSMDKRKIEKVVRLLLNSPEIRHLLPLSEIALRNASSEVYEFFRIYPDCSIIQSDKGKKTCLMLKADYEKKMSSYIERCIIFDRSNGSKVVEEGNWKSNNNL